MAAEKMQKMKDNIIAAHNLKNSMSTVIRVIREAYHEDRFKVSSNRNLSQEGKDKELERIQQYYEVFFMKTFKEERKNFEALLNENVKISQGILLQSLEPVNTDTEKLFMQQLEALESKVIYATNVDAARQALEQMAAIATEPALAVRAKDKIKELSPQIIALAPNDKVLNVKRDLGRLFDDITTRSLPKGAAEAQENLQSAQEFLKVDLVSPVIFTSVLGEISNDLPKYANNADQYFSDKADFIKEVEMNGRGY